jgi:hypothetical protein
VAQSADVDGICVSRIDYDPADLLRLIEANVCPCLAAVARFIHAIAGGEVRSNIRLAGSCINGFGIGWGNSYRADRSDGLVIEDRIPDRSCVGGFPDAAIHRAEIKRRWIARHTGDRYCASAAERADQSPLQSVEKLGRD